MDSEPAGSDVEVNTEVKEVESVSDEVGGTYLPEFLSESPIGGDWSINVKMANAIQANEQFKKHCGGGERTLEADVGGGSHSPK